MQTKALQTENEKFMQSVREKDAELSSLREKTRLQMNTLGQELQRSDIELGNIPAQLQQVCREVEQTQKLQKEQFHVLQCAVFEADNWAQNCLNDMKLQATLQRTEPVPHLLTLGKDVCKELENTVDKEIIAISPLNLLKDQFRNWWNDCTNDSIDPL